jgi:hypothetical protein
LNEVNMRRLIMLSAVLAIAACSDSQQVTSPAKARSVSPGAVSMEELSQGAHANGKPQPGPVGFTQVAQYFGDWASFQAGQTGSAMALCPAGQTAIAGGYQFASLAGTHPLINGSARLELPSATGWIIYAMNDQAGAGSFNLDAYVICAS